MSQPHNVANVMTAFVIESYAIPLDRVYTAKMMMGIRDMVQLAQISSSKSIAAIHTGGLQGNQSINAELVF